MTSEPNSAEAIRRAWDRRVDEYACMVRNPARRGLAVEIELAAFRQHLPEGRLSLMDAGCGPGAHGRRLLAEGHSVCFVDLSPAMLARCRAECEAMGGPGEARFLQLDLRSLDGLSDGEFDGVISGGTVVSDCGDPATALGELARVLRCGGVLGMSLRNLDGPEGPPSGDPLVLNGGPGFDWWCFSIESAAGLCEKAGLTVRRVYPALAFPPTPHEPEGYVRRHLEPGPQAQWRPAAHELFVIAAR